MIYNAISGGTGAGFSSIILERLADEYVKKTKLAFPIFPTDYSQPLSNSIVEPYNSVLHLSKLIENVDVSFMIENPAVYRLCTDKLKISRPKYGSLNRVIAQVISSLTVSLRRASDFNIDIQEYATNLVPFPKLNFMLTSFAPLRAFDDPIVKSVKEITWDAFE